MPCNHIMLDLETLSTRKDAAIIQIAALAFDPETGEHGLRFNAYVRNPSGHIDPQTVAWWMQQAHAPVIGARIADGTGGEAYVLDLFAQWLAERVNRPAPAGAGVVALWSHGATFDIVVLENALTRNCMPKPWSYRIERDTRTLYAIAPGGCPVITDLDESRKHDALYDCEVQVQQVVGALRALREQGDHAALYLGRLGDLSGERADAVAPTLRATEPFLPCTDEARSAESFANFEYLDSGAPTS